MAVREALFLILREMWDPTTATSISVEARIANKTGQVGFDLSIEPGALHIEVKLAPSRQEIHDWLASLPDAFARCGTAQFKLIYAKGGVAAADVTEVCRVAREAHNLAHFRQLVADTLSEEQRALVRLLGIDAWEIASRTEAQQRLESEVRDLVEWIATQLAGGDGGRQIEELIEAKFRRGAEGRQTFRVADMIQEIRDRHIYLHAPYPANLDSGNHSWSQL